MKQHLFSVLSCTAGIILMTACKKDSEKAEDPATLLPLENDRVLIEPKLTPTYGELTLSASTANNYDCLEAKIFSSGGWDYSQDTATANIFFKAIVLPNDKTCVPGQAPARGTVYVGNPLPLKERVYKIRITVGTEETKGKLTVTKDRYHFDLEDTTRVAIHPKEIAR